MFPIVRGISRALSATASKKMSRPRAVVIAGPSGVGKGTLIGKLFSEFPDLFGFSVSHTTRAPRAGEEDGVDYNYTTVEKFLADVEAGKFIEHAEVHGRYYGTSVAAVERIREKGQICVLDIDVQGCRIARTIELEAKFIFIAPPSIEILESRLRGRGTESEADIRTRIGNAQRELDATKEEGLFDSVIVNDSLAKAYSDLKLLLGEEIKAAAALDRGRKKDPAVAED